MNYAHEITKLSTLVAQANVAPHHAAIADIEKRIAAEREALDRAETRRGELVKELEQARAGTIDSDMLADQFRAGAVETKATREVTAIQQDIEAVREAIGKLKWAIEDLQAELRTARAKLAQAIAQPLEKIEDSLIERIDAAYRELVTVYVDARALREAFCAPMIGKKLHALREIIVELQDQESQFYRTQHDASPAIAEAIDKHRELIRAADLRPTKTVNIRY